MDLKPIQFTFGRTDYAITAVSHFVIVCRRAHRHGRRKGHIGTYDGKQTHHATWADAFEYVLRNEHVTAIDGLDIVELIDTYRHVTDEAVKTMRRQITDEHRFDNAKREDQAKVDIHE